MSNYDKTGGVFYLTWKTKKKEHGIGFLNIHPIYSYYFKEYGKWI